MNLTLVAALADLQGDDLARHCLRHSVHKFPPSQSQVQIDSGQSVESVTSCAMADIANGLTVHIVGTETVKRSHTNYIGAVLLQPASFSLSFLKFPT